MSFQTNKTPPSLDIHQQDQRLFTMSKYFIFNLFFCFFFSINSFFVAHSITLPSDFIALKAFKESIKQNSIPSASCLASWDFSTDPCSNPRVTHFTCGVACDANRVTELTLDPAGYSGRLTPLVSKLTQLISLDLADNHFYGPIPPALFTLPNLENLVLRVNSFSGSVPPTISEAKALQTLDFSHNLLSGSLPRSLNSLTRLRRIDLSFNKLTGSIPKLPPNLIQLAIKANSLAGPLYKSSFDGLTQLEVVELSENSFTGTIEAWFFLLPSLQQVDLAKNSFTRVEIMKPKNLGKNLVAVDLSFNKIEGELPLNFADYPLLSSLSFRYNRLRGPVPLQYSKKRSLTRLYLDGNYLNGSPPAGFFSGHTSVSGSFGDNCLRNCPTSSQLCLKSQKPISICQQAYRGKHRT